MGSKICQRKRKQRKRNRAWEERKSSHWGHCCGCYFDRRCGYCCGCYCGAVLLCVQHGSLPCEVGGSCLHGFLFGILEVRLKQFSFRLLVLCMLGQLLFFIEIGSFKADLTKIKHVNIAMCQLTAETNCNGWIANKTKFQGVKSKF